MLPFQAGILKCTPAFACVFLVPATEHSINVLPWSPIVLSFLIGGASLYTELPTRIIGSRPSSVLFTDPLYRFKVFRVFRLLLFDLLLTLNYFFFVFFFFDFFFPSALLSSLLATCSVIFLITGEAAAKAGLVDGKTAGTAT